IRDNVFFFLENIRKKNWRFDFIVIDPPTMSRSKKMERKFDIQRDHSELINLSLPYLEKGGKILFSTNFRKFRLESENIDADNIRDITEDTIPEDFKDKRIHKAWIIS
ncbi:MAG TPA: SAM-dependent methyltransferase, partial [Leptospiraceae bacterium]|nr:SAM-dependent methyltransferase [Leptospiraceae bacterium]